MLLLMGMYAPVLAAVKGFQVPELSFSLWAVVWAC